MAIQQEPIYWRYLPYIRPIFQAYFSGLWKGISPQNMALYDTVPSFQDPEIPTDWWFKKMMGCM